MTIRPLFQTPACWNDRKTGTRLANIFDRDKPGEVVLGLAGEDCDRIAGLIAAGLVNNQPTEALRLRLLNAVACAHSGDAAEGQRIVACVLQELCS
jgi:hypothetical protein